MIRTRRATHAQQSVVVPTSAKLDRELMAVMTPRSLSWSQLM